MYRLLCTLKTTGIPLFLYVVHVRRLDTHHKACIINPFPALIKSKYLLKFDYFCSIFISRRWSAVSLNHSIPPEPMMNQLRDGGGFVA